jgi:hypothetical protein
MPLGLAFGVELSEQERATLSTLIERAISVQR